MHDRGGGVYPCIIEVDVYPCMIEVEVCTHA